MKDFYSLGAFFADVKQWGIYQDYEYTPNPELKGCLTIIPGRPRSLWTARAARRAERLRGQIASSHRRRQSAG